MSKYNAKLVPLQSLSQDELDDLEEDGMLNFFYKFQNEVIIAEEHKSGMMDCYKLSKGKYSIDCVPLGFVILLKDYAEEKEVKIIEVERKKTMAELYAYYGDDKFDPKWDDKPWD